LFDLANAYDAPCGRLCRDRKEFQISSGFAEFPWGDTAKKDIGDYAWKWKFKVPQSPLRETLRGQKIGSLSAVKSA